MGSGDLELALRHATLPVFGREKDGKVFSNNFFLCAAVLERVRLPANSPLIILARGQLLTSVFDLDTSRIRKSACSRGITASARNLAATFLTLAAA
jgi:hypothetical protein